MLLTVAIPAVLTFLATGISAHPKGAHFVHLDKRQRREYFAGDHYVVEDTVVKTVTLPYGSQPTPPVTKPKDKHVVHYQQQDQQQPPNQSPPVVNQQPDTQPSPSSSASDSAPTGTTGGSTGGTGGEIDPKGGSAWTQPPTSGGKSVLESINEWTKKFNSNHATYQWDSTLAQNAMKTAKTPTTWGPDKDDQGNLVPHNEGGANTEGHWLYDGSMGQTIAPGSGGSGQGSLTAFETAFVGWLCEEPSDALPCSSIHGIDWSKSGTGHAEIIGHASYTKIGCFYMDSTQSPPGSWNGMYTCDFA